MSGEYVAVPAGETDYALGLATSGSGDYLERLICVVATAATSNVSIKDGTGSSISILPANVGGGVGTYPIVVDARSISGRWKVTTGAGVTVMAIGRFQNYPR